MKKLTNIAAAIILLISLASCGDEERIKNLEEENAKLQNELKEEKEKYKSLSEISDRIQQEWWSDEAYIKAHKEITSVNRNSGDNSEDYFTIGSTEKEVIRVMGDPSSIDKNPFSKYFSYGPSQITFENGKVTGYENRGNLKVKMKNH